MDRKAFIDIISPDKAEGALKRAYRRIGGKRGNIAHVHQSQSLHPKAMLGHLDLYMALMYDQEASLSRLQRELIGTIVSVLNKCEYCIVHHYEALKVYWEDAPLPEDLVKGKELDEQNMVMLDHTIKLINEPWNIAENDINKLGKQGFDDQAILEITMIAGYFSFVNRITLGLGVRLENESERDYQY